MTARAALPFVAALAILAGLSPAAAACRSDRVEFRTDRGIATFRVELATTEAEREYGLMNRDALPGDAGMLFVYETAGEPAFWMKNTRIPLDMIFIDPTGRVTRVHPQARPGDLTPIPGGPNVLEVLELNAGAAARAGIVPGTAMRSPTLDQAGAVWACAAP